MAFVGATYFLLGRIKETLKHRGKHGKRENYTFIKEPLFMYFVGTNGKKMIH